MKSIGENIAVLRKNKGMTQEALASAIGVSSQAVSKWENGTNLPDVALLPILADIFEVNIDQMFGRGLSESCSSEQVLEKGCEALLNVMGSSLYSSHYRNGAEPDKTFEDSQKDYRNYLKEHEDARTAVFRSHGAVYYREERGGMLLKKPEEGWVSLLKSEKAVELLEMLCIKDFRIALVEVLKSRKTMFTLGAICQNCDIEDEAALEVKLRESGMFKTHQVEVDGRMLDLYELAFPEGALVMLYATFAFADECAQYKEHFYNYNGCHIQDLMG